MLATAGTRQKGSAMRIRNRILAARSVLLLVALTGTATLIAAAPVSSLQHVSGQNSQVVAAGQAPGRGPVETPNRQGARYLMAPDPPPIGPKPS
jgi:hypothetical protein